MNRSRLFQIAALVVVFFTVVSWTSACATPAPAVPPPATALPSSASATPAPPAASAGPIELKAVFAGAGAEKVMLDAIPKFEKEHPGIKVQFQRVEWSDADQKIQLMFSSGQGPDVYLVYGTKGPVYAKLGVAAPLDSVLNQKDFLSSAWTYGVVDSKSYFVPWTMQPRPLWWRKSFFQEAGLDSNKPPATWEEIRQYAKKLTKYDDKGNIVRSGFTVFSSLNKSPWLMAVQFNDFLRQAGGRFFNPEGTAVVFNSPEGVKALQFLVDLLRVDKVDLPGAEHDTSTDLVQGKVAMITEGDWVIQQFQGKLEDVGVGKPPAGKMDACTTGGDVMLLSSKSKHPQEAAELMRYLLLNHSADYSATKGKAIPVVNKVLESDSIKKDPVLQFTSVFGATCADSLMNPKFDQIDLAIRPFLQDALLGNKPVDQALNQAAAAANKILSEK